MSITWLKEEIRFEVGDFFVTCSLASGKFTVLFLCFERSRSLTASNVSFLLMAIHSYQVLKFNGVFMEKYLAALDALLFAI